LDGEGGDEVEELEDEAYVVARSSVKAPWMGQTVGLGPRARVRAA